MEVLSVTLKNFKVHRDRYYEFSSGTNAICGENGAGKTSIFEAIAWVLFDYSDYAKAELISTGATSAQATVVFLSNLDGRAYEVWRCTSRGYQVYDPQLNLNLGLKKVDDVKQWLCEHLGVPAQTELPKLFAEAIGIPQGTLTLDFLKRVVERKKVFDPILKVEEYKQVFDQTRDLEVYARGQVEELERVISTADQHLADWLDLQQQVATLTQTIAQDQDHIEQLTHKEQQLHTQLEALTAQAQHLQALTTQVQQLQTQLASKADTTHMLEQAWTSAQRAAQICRQHRSSFQAYEQAQGTLTTLAQQQRQRQQLQQQRETLCTQWRDLQTEQSQLQGRLESFTQMGEYLSQWQALVPHQDQLEAQQAECQTSLQLLASKKLQLHTQQQQLSQHQQTLKVLADEIKHLVQLEPQVRQLPDLEAQRQELQQHLSRVEAAQQFGTELQQLVTQIEPDRQRYQAQVEVAKAQLQMVTTPSIDLTQVTQTLTAGLTLNSEILSALKQLLETLADPTALPMLKAQLQQLQDHLLAAQAAQIKWSTLELKQQQQAILTKNVKQGQEECDRLQTQLQQVPQRQAQLTQLTADLAQLQDPKGQIRVLEQQLQQEPQVQAAMTDLNSRSTQLQQQIAELDKPLKALTDLETQVEAQQQIQQTHQEAYQQYLRHRNEANTCKQLDQQLRGAITERDQLQQQLDQIQANWQQQSQHHDPQQLAQVTLTYQQVKSQRDQLQGGLPPKQQQLQTLEQQVQARQQISEQRERDRTTLAQKQRVLQFVRDARRIYNQSGPQITKYYLNEISWEADNLFRELLNRMDVALEWTEDYEIRVQEQGHWRSFKSLSGGEQMCAALAVRLALLKVLADINVAFFDEPTTNMDQARRRQLAEALGNLKTFRQLFVISHDDTFECVTENIIRVEREKPLTTGES